MPEGCRCLVVVVVVVAVVVVVFYPPLAFLFLFAATNNFVCIFSFGNNLLKFTLEMRTMLLKKPPRLLQVSQVYGHFLRKKMIDIFTV